MALHFKNFLHSDTIKHNAVASLHSNSIAFALTHQCPTVATLYYEGMVMQWELV